MASWTEFSKNQVIFYKNALKRIFYCNKTLELFVRLVLKQEESFWILINFGLLNFFNSKLAFIQIYSVKFTL